VTLFLDSVDLDDIAGCLSRGIIGGVTTNPLLMARQPKTDFLGHMRRIAAMLRRSGGGGIPLSAAVVSRNAGEMVAEAHELLDAIQYPTLNIKVPVGWDELGVVRQLASEGIAVNCTAMITESQCLLAATAGATYVSIFLGRSRDVGLDPLPVIARTRRLLDRDGLSTRIIVGSVRHMDDIVDALDAGAHIVTARAGLLQEMASHPQSTKSIAEFLDAFEEWRA
jgi:transaldolase